MPASIFAGSKVKTLKSTLSLNGGADIISSATNPQSSAVDAVAGSLLLNTTTGIMYRKLDAGSTTNWVEVGSGAGQKNYIKNPDFDGGQTTNWSMRKVSLSGVFPTGNIGTEDAGHSIAASSSSPLEGANSLLVQGASLFTAGNCLVSDAFAIDREDQAKVMGWSFYYEAVTTNMDFPGTSAGTWAVYIAEVTTATPNTVVSWIQPAGVYNLTQSSGVGLASGTFQTTASGTAYRLVLVCINSEAAATTLKVDDFQLGPQKVVYGSPVTDWVSYTPVATGLGTGSANVVGRFRRVGDSYEVEGYIQATVAGTGASGVTLSLPGSIDLSKLSNSSVGFVTLGVANFFNGATTAYSDQWTVIYDGNINQVKVIKGGTATLLVGSDLTLNSRIVLNFKMPASGLSSSVQMSNDTDTRVVAARSVSSNSGAWPTSDTVINFASVSYDTHGAITTGAGWNYRIPVSGYYKVSASHQGTSSGATTLILRARKNGSVFATALFPTNSAITNAAPRVDGQNYFNAGDTIDIVASSSAGGTFVNSTSVNVVQIERLSGPATIAASETVGCAYVQTAALTPGIDYANRTLARLITRQFDTHGIYNTATGIGTIPISGKWYISAQLLLDRSSGVVGDNGGVIIRINSTDQRESWHRFISTTAGSVTPNAVGVLNLNAGDTFSIYCYVTGTSGRSNPANALTNYLNVIRVGN